MTEEGKYCFSIFRTLNDNYNLHIYAGDESMECIDVIDITEQIHHEIQSVVNEKVKFVLNKIFNEDALKVTQNYG